MSVKRNEDVEGERRGKGGRMRKKSGEDEDTMEKTDGGDALHAQNKRVRKHISRIGKRVLLPELTEEIGHRRHACVVYHEVAFEEEMDCSTCQSISMYFHISNGLEDSVWVRCTHITRTTRPMPDQFLSRED